MVSNGALVLTDDRLLRLAYDPAEFARMQQAEVKLAEMLKALGKFADAVNSIVGGALARTKEFTAATQRGVPVEQVEMNFESGRLSCVITFEGRLFDMRAYEWEYDKAMAEKFVVTLEEMKRA